MEQRAQAEKLYWAICRKVRRLLRQGLEYVPEELDGLDAMLAETYFCNFSLFQSIPDSWAIKQLFPIMPIHRLDERPTHHAVLGDITCDSDGKVERFIDRRDVKRTLPLHTFDGQPYYLGAFLVGAYQEILGDLHNLFGDTNAVHVSIDEQGDLVIEEVVKGDTVREVLQYVQFDPKTSSGPAARLGRSRGPPQRHRRPAGRPHLAFLRVRPGGLHVSGTRAGRVGARGRTDFPIRLGVGGGSGNPSAIDALPRRERLKHRPVVMDNEVGTETEMVKMFEKMSLVPTFFLSTRGGIRNFSRGPTDSPASKRFAAAFARGFRGPLDRRFA